ncbi:nitrite reductase [Aliikangiella sp. G2MR2-5]|uniref:nitrite reductase n=1 Tax=Aliikangiella sp. G2MR2-5 TaxID=2788943 RepID=UPI0018AA3381|nr:nitrite reductase [Aliikangiella sp. G2MR2-5]
MNLKQVLWGISGLLAFAGGSIALAATVDSDSDSSAKKDYLQHCASCHGEARLGGIGPALLPDNLSRTRKKAAIDVISNGRALTQMPGFGALLSEKQIKAVADYVYQPPKLLPKWEAKEIGASRVEHFDQDKLGNKPVFKADLQNLFIVVETGDHHATLLNGDTFEPIHRFKTRFAVHGGPKYSPDGRYVYFASRDGWISKFDIYNLKTVAEVRAGINTRNAAMSFDGKTIAVGNYLPNNMVLLDARDLSLIKIIDAKNDEGKSSRVSAVYTAPTRGSFVAAMKDFTEIWEIPYSGENKFKARRVVLEDYLDDFFFNQDYSLVIGASRPANSKGHQKNLTGKVINLDTGKLVSNIDIKGMPHLGSGITWDYQGTEVLASPNLSKGEVSVIDMKSWKTVKTLKTEGPGFFMRSHEGSKYAWADVFFGPNKDKIHVIDKSTLEIVKTLQPEPGKTAAHIEYTKDGKYALLSIWDMDGAVIVYDAETLKEVKRLPMKKPSGKYNVYNKTHYERGTSH